MRQPEPGPVRRPREDDRLMRNVLFGIAGNLAVLVAHDLKLYPVVSEYSAAPERAAWSRRRQGTIGG